MTAPDPTAGERECRYPCDCGQFHDEHCACMDGHALPAVAASAGTSEDVEALAEVLYAAACRQGPTVAAWDFARAVLASDWLAAREAAARAEERERIAQAIEALPSHHLGVPYVNQRAAARIAREVRP